MKLSPLFLMTSIAAIAVAIVYLVAIEFSAIPFGTFSSLAQFTVSALIDRYVVTSFDTLEEIKKGNIAAAIYFFGLFIAPQIGMLAAR